MTRDLHKAVAEYEKKYFDRSDGKGAFYNSDYQQIVDMAKAADEYERIMPEAIWKALEAGFMIGYRTACRDMGDKRRRA